MVNSIDANPNSSIKPYKERLSDPNNNVFYNAPCLVLLVGKVTTAHTIFDFGLAGAYFMFAATSRGLGTCWIGLGEVIHDPGLRKEIGLPDDYDIIAPIIIGYPQSIPEMPGRKEPHILKII